ncbi:hypothetical protein U9J35_12880 [Rossellomorea aquimaris]|nr:hypothetical protein [Rossellomorea aquimaris]WRP04811.1 hypothetical protein U9J35_12880 [Rossellomorea aquimaris]
MSNKKEKEKEVKSSSTESRETVWDSFWKLSKSVEVNKEEKTVKWF